MQVNQKAGMDFAVALKASLRQDPDIVMIGEIRDEVVAKQAITTALTGHLVLTTLHTKNALGVPARLIDLGVSPVMLSIALLGMTSQRLVRKICPKDVYKRQSYQREMKERQRVANLYTFENECRANGYKLIAGVDEVGRGPLAGPVVVASVILPENFFIEKINDSKKLSEATREKIYDIIMENAIAVNRAIIDEKTIDRVNIYQAAMNGMYEAIYGLNPKPDAVLIDAMPLESLDIYHQSIIKGDAKSASIAAASIVAKVRCV